MDNPSETIETQLYKQTATSTEVFANHDADDHSHLLRELSLKPRDRYKFVRTIGIGGMKTVLLVYDKDTRRHVALAMMPDFTERSEKERARFIHEALITAKLEHPHIIPIHDIGIDSNMAPYFSMTFLSGMMLSALISRMKNGDEKLLEFYYMGKMLLNFQKICHAVEFAHSQNILHLDLKPANVHIGKYGEVHVLDWGLAREQKGIIEERISISSTTCGTPGYMAPEQIVGKKLDERTDVFSLGCILFSILMFRSPATLVDGGKAKTNEVLKATVEGTLIKEVKFVNEQRTIPVELEEICRKAMACNPEERYQTVKELRDDISYYLSNYPTLAGKVAPTKKILLFVKRNLVIVSVISALTIVVLTILVIFLLEKYDKISFHF